MSEGNQERLVWLLEVVAREGRHLQQTSGRLFTQPLDEAWYASLEADPELAERVDAFAARFGRMQDTLGDRLIPELLRQLLETPGSALDNLHRMEKLGLLRSTEEWVEARNLRNRLVHEYIRDARTFLDALNRAGELVPMLVQTYNAILGYAGDHLPGLAERAQGRLPE